MKYQDVLKRFVSEQAQLLQQKQMKQQMQEQRLAESAQALGSFVPGQQQSPQEEYSETEHNPFEEGQEYKAGGIHIDPSKKGTFKAQATRMNMSIQEAASHILNNRERYSPGMVKKANFAKNFAKEEGGMFTGDYEYEDGGEFDKPRFSVGLNASPEMGSLVSPSLNFEKGKFNANLSTDIPIEMPERYSKNLNVNANYNTGKFGNIGVSGSAYKDEEGMPAYNAGVRYEVPISDKLNFMLNADTSSFKNLKDNANVSAGLRFNFKEGGDKKSVVENTSGPRADESYIPMDYLSFINSDEYAGSMSTNEALMNPATGVMDKVYRQEGNPMSIDYIKSKLADKSIVKTPYNNLDPVHRYYDTELVNSSRDAYDTHKQSHLKQKVEGEVQNYPDMEDVIKGAHEHNLKNGYDDTDIITSHLTNQANKEGLDIYDFMSKYYGGSSPNAVARQLLVDYSKKMKK